MSVMRMDFSSMRTLLGLRAMSLYGGIVFMK
jgi:hypothetical protein